MKILLTGANGFLGRYVAGELLCRGHAVRALIRPPADDTALKQTTDSRLEIVRADLLEPSGLSEALAGVDGVIHLAAAKSGDYPQQFAGTVTATENLLRAMDAAEVRRLVAVSSFSVYDFLRAPADLPIDEQTPLESTPADRDAYAQTKLAQERLIRDHARRNGLELVVLRPGMIWGKGNLLNAWIGIPAGSRAWLRTGGSARVPLTYVENCAEAIALAAESPAATGQTLNVLDDDLPTQRQFAAMALKRSSPRRWVVPVPYGLLRLASGTAWFISRRVLRGKARVPGLLVPARLQARARPLTYSNDKVKNVLGWRPRYTLAEGLQRSAASPSA